MTDRPDPLDEHREELAGELVRVARAEPRSRVRAVLGRRMTVPLALLALGSGAAGIAIAAGGDGTKTVPVSYPVKDAVGHEVDVTTEIGVGIECTAEADWWDEQVAQGGGAIALAEASATEMHPEGLFQVILPRPPADICDE